VRSGLRINVVPEHCTVKYVSENSPNNDASSNASLRTQFSIRSLQLAKGWYMLEVSGNGHTIGSNLSLVHIVDQSDQTVQEQKSEAACYSTFNILLGSHAVSKRLIRNDKSSTPNNSCASGTQSTGIVFTLDGHIEQDQLPYISLSRVSGRFAINRMKTKLAYASSKSLLGYGVKDRMQFRFSADYIKNIVRIRKNHECQLYGAYHKLMERHIKPMTYSQWLAGKTTDKLDDGYFENKKNQINTNTPPHLLLEKRIVLVAVIGEVVNISQLDSICLALGDLHENCSVRIVFMGQSAVVSHVQKSLEVKAAAISYSTFSSSIDFPDTLDRVINSVYCDFRIFIGNAALLGKDCLTKQVETILDNKETTFVYSDHDAIDEFGIRTSPVFKPEWNAELLLNTNYIGYCFLIRDSLFLKVGGWNSAHAQSAFYDVFLRSIGHIDSESVVRIPEILWHKYVGMDGSVAHGNRGYLCQNHRDVWVLDSYLNKKENVGYSSSHKRDDQRLNSESLANNEDPSSRVNGMYASHIVDGQLAGTYKISRTFGKTLPSVDIVIPTRDKVGILRTCVDSVLEKTSYTNYRIKILDNGSIESETLEYFSLLQSNQNVFILRVPGEFNYSALNNRAVESSTADVIVLLNNDTEVIDGQWLHEMVQHAVQPGVGCVGAKLIYSNGRIQHGGVILGLKGMAGHAHRFLPRSDDGYCGRLKLSQDVTAVTAACLAVRRSVYNEVEGLDEVNLKVAYNDVDFCLRCREAGYRNIWTPYAELYHHESVSRGSEDTPEKVKRFRYEYNYMLDRWKTQELWDPAYNPNLSKDLEDFSLAA